MDVQAWLTERMRLVDGRLDELLPLADGAPSPALSALHTAMRHLVFPGGKRLRPGFAMAAAEALGRPPEEALPAACAVELIHTYSLIHDDLPCMDDDDERRGRPAVHRIVPEATAVLAGDALQALAFETLSAGGADPERRACAVADLAAAAGAGGLVGGQVDDIACDGADPSRALIESIHLRKSAELISAACVCGARLAGGSEAEIARFRDFGLRMGVAFQIADDLLDEGEDEACSVVAAVGAEAAAVRAEELLDSALAIVEPLGERAEPLRELARLSVRRDR